MYDSVAILGPTASGKSALGMKLAHQLDGEIVCCDSTQIYKKFDIGTAKPTHDEQSQIKHHMLDLIEWNVEFDAGKYAALARNVIKDIQTRKKLPIIIGGTGLYFRSLTNDSWDALPSDANIRSSFKDKDLSFLYLELQKKDPTRASQLHPNDRFRIERALEIISVSGKPVSQLSQQSSTQIFNPVIIYLDPPKKILDERIVARAHKMFQNGFEDEVNELLKSGVDPNSKIMNSIGYKETKEFLCKKTNLEGAIKAMVIATRQYAKRQNTWFRKVKVHIHNASCAGHVQDFSLHNIFQKIS